MCVRTRFKRRRRQGRRLEKRLRATLALCVVSVFLFSPSTAICGDERVGFEITFARQSVSYASEASWDWWSPDKYDQWQTLDEPHFELADARLVIAGKTYSGIFEAEVYPELGAEGSYEDPTSGELVEHQLSGEIRVYDAAIGQLSSRGDSYWIPWFGLTHIRADGRRTISSDGVALDQEPDESSTESWGLVLGVAGGYEVRHRLSVTGRAVIRWAKGTRDAVFYPLNSGTGDPDVGRVESSDSVNTGMWGAEAGISWAAFEGFALEGGWRYRDWRYDDGPASFNGPYARLSMVF